MHVATLQDSSAKLQDSSAIANHLVNDSATIKDCSATVNSLCGLFG